MFNANVNLVFKGIPLSAAQEINPSDYNPSGGTALFDAQALALETLTELNPNPGPEDAFLLITITDGAENCSKKFRKDWNTGKNTELSQMIEEKENSNQWTLTLLGDMSADQTHNIAASLGRSVLENSISTAGLGVDTVGVTASESLSNYMSARTMGATAVNNFYGTSDELGNKSQNSD